MPEGPEIRRAADDVEKALKERTVKRIDFAFNRLKPYEKTLQGSLVTGVDTKGKAMLTRFDNGWTIYSHNQLYGKWIIRPAFDYPNTDRQLRMAIHNNTSSALLYSASDIEVMPDEEMTEHPFIKKAGPDILSEKVTAEKLLAQITHPAFYKRKWASLLLDQSFIAGIGNYLRSEILFVSGIYPELRPKDCSQSRLVTVAETTIHLMHQAYEHNGITLDLSLKNRNVDERHWVFNREERPCYVCTSPIEKRQSASRRLYYCPNCQQK